LFSFKEACAGGRQKAATPLKSGYFAAIDSFRVNTVADRHRYIACVTSNDDELFNAVHIDDLE